MQVATGARGPWALVSIGVVASLLAGPGSTEHVRVQAAVTADGFLAAQSTGTGQHVLTLDRDGHILQHHTFARAGDVRIVGTRAGAVAVYEERGRIRLARVDGGADDGMFGSSVQRVCDGVATNDARFAVGWLESDDKFWFVHGPVASSTMDTGTDAGPVEVATLGRKSWCGIASAGAKIALLWRDRDRLQWTSCTTKKCGMPGSAKVPATDLVLGFGCAKNTCLVALRDPNASVKLALIAESGSILWSQPLETRATHVSIIGAGDQAYAVGADNAVFRVDRAGKRTPLWKDGTDRGAPQLALSRSRLLIARVGATAVIELPR